MIEGIGHDIRFSLRTLRKAPCFTAIAVITIALGIAANVTVFSYVNALFLRDLPLKKASRLVRVYGTAKNRNDRFFSYPEYVYLRDHTATIEQLVAHYSTAPFYVNVNEQAGEVQGCPRVFRALRSARHRIRSGLPP